MARRWFSWLSAGTALAALVLGAWGLIAYVLDAPPGSGATVREATQDLGERPVGPEFPVTIWVQNDGCRRCRIIGVGGAG